MSTSKELLKARKRYILEYNSAFGTFQTKYRYFHKELAKSKEAPQTVETQNKCAKLEAQLMELTSTWKQQEPQIRENVERIDRHFEMNHFLSEICGSFSNCDNKYSLLTTRIYSLPLLFPPKKENNLHTFILLCGTRQQCFCDETACKFESQHAIADSSRRYTLVDVMDITTNTYPKTREQYIEKHNSAVKQLKNGNAMVLCLLNKHLLNVTHPLLQFYHDNMPPHAITCVLKKWRDAPHLTFFDTSPEPDERYIKVHEALKMYVQEMLELPTIASESHYDLGKDLITEMHPNHNGWCLLISWLVARQNATTEKLTKTVADINEELKNDLITVFALLNKIVGTNPEKEFSVTPDNTVIESDKQVGRFKGMTAYDFEDNVIGKLKHIMPDIPWRQACENIRRKTE